MQVTIILMNSMSNMVHHRRITQKLCNQDCQLSVRLLVVMYVLIMCQIFFNWVKWGLGVM